MEPGLLIKEKKEIYMSQKKKSPLKNHKDKDLPGFQNLEGLKLEHDTCYRGRIEIWKDKKGNIVKQSIIR